MYLAEHIYVCMIYLLLADNDHDDAIDINLVVRLWFLRWQDTNHTVEPQSLHG